MSYHTQTRDTTHTARLNRTIRHASCYMHRDKNMSTDATQLERIPPQNLEAEKSLLGSILIEKDAVAKIGGIMVK